MLPDNISMTSNIPGKLQQSNKLRGIVLSKSTARWFVPVTIFAATCAAFLPILWNDFVEWDTYMNAYNLIDRNSTVDILFSSKLLLIKQRWYL